MFTDQQILTFLAVQMTQMSEVLKRQIDSNQNCDLNALKNSNAGGHFYIDSVNPQQQHAVPQNHQMPINSPNQVQNSTKPAETKTSNNRKSAPKNYQHNGKSMPLL